MHQDVIAASSEPVVAMSDPVLSSTTISGAQNWQTELAAATMTVSELLERLNISVSAASSVLTDEQLDGCFPLIVPPRYLARIEQGNLNDPLLRQILPLKQELEKVPGYSADPLDESEFNPVPGLIHKYKSRVLLTVSSKCAIHCRYCFRREFSYQDNNPGRKGWQQALGYIRARPEINEVIFSGGDPLSASDKTLDWLIRQLAEIPTLKFLRIHSRLPAVIPSRINAPLLESLKNWKQQQIVVLHCNHPAEIDNEVAKAINKLIKARVTVLNQSVLLRGVNDDATVLAELSRKLFEVGALPYYLHLLDRVRGTHHFEVAEEKALALYRELSAILPGYLVPKLARESSGYPAKTILSNSTRM